MQVCVVEKIVLKERSNPDHWLESWSADQLSTWQKEDVHLSKVLEWKETGVKPEWKSTGNH